MLTKMMDKYRRRLLEAMVFFSSRRGVRNPSKMMMYKLLAELDFRHFQQTGLPVTNLEYRAYKWGPLPEKLHQEITKDDSLILPADFAEALKVEKTEFAGDDGKVYEGFKYIARRKPNLKVFSPRQLRLLEEVATIYKTATATEASKASHEPNKPWTITVKMKGEKALIDLLETIELEKPLTKEIARDRLNERKALIYNYGA